MLTRATIEHFRSCRTIKLANIDELTVLLGRNGVGKTNIMRAILWAAQSAVRQGALVHERDAGRLGPSKVSLEFKTEGETYRYTIQATQGRATASAPLAEFAYHERLERLSEAKFELLVERDDTKLKVGNADQLRIDKRIPALFAARSLKPSDSAISYISAASRYLSRVRYYPLDEPGYPDQQIEFVRFADYINWSSGQKQANTIESVIFRLIKLLLDRPEDFKGLKEVLGTNGLGLIDDMRIDYFSISDGKTDSGKLTSEVVKKNFGGNSDKTFVFVTFKPTDRIDTVFTFPQLSLGTRRLIRLFTFVVAERASFCMIEQPEDGIHQGLLHKVIPQLLAYGEGRQYLISTHAAGIVNRVSPSQLRLVHLETDGTHVDALNQKQLKLAAQYMEDDGTLADFTALLEQD